MGHIHKYKKSIIQKLRKDIEYEVSPNAINEKKIKLWSYMMQNTQRGSSREKEKSQKKKLGVT